MNLRSLVAILFLGTTALSACNTSASGAEGVLLFTPNQCGRLGCNFDDSIGVGGRIFVHISPAMAGVSTVGLDLESGDSGVFTVEPVADFGGEPTWELTGIEAGVAQLFAVDQGGEDVDFLEVAVQELTALSGRGVLGDAVGPTADPDFDEVWTVNAETPVSIQIDPLIGDGVPTMGRYEYTTTLDAGLADGILDANGLGDGYLYFDVPAGEYTASFEDDFGHAIDLLIVAQPTI